MNILLINHFITILIYHYIYYLQFQTIILFIILNNLFIFNFKALKFIVVKI